MGYLSFPKRIHGAGGMIWEGGGREGGKVPLLPLFRCYYVAAAAAEG